MIYRMSSALVHAACEGCVYAERTKGNTSSFSGLRLSSTVSSHATGMWGLIQGSSTNTVRRFHSAAALSSQLQRHIYCHY